MKVYFLKYFDRLKKKEIKMHNKNLLDFLL